MLNALPVVLVSRSCSRSTCLCGRNIVNFFGIFAYPHTNQPTQSTPYHTTLHTPHHFTSHLTYHTTLCIAPTPQHSTPIHTHHTTQQHSTPHHPHHIAAQHTTSPTPHCSTAHHSTHTAQYHRTPDYPPSASLKPPSHLSPALQRCHKRITIKADRFMRGRKELSVGKGWQGGVKQIMRRLSARHKTHCSYTRVSSCDNV